MSGLTRQEIKRDEVREGLVKAIDWIAENVQKILIAIGVVVVGFIVWGAVGLFLDNRGDRAQEQLATALDVYQAPIVLTDASPDDVESPTFSSLEERRARASELLRAIPERSSAGEIASVYLANIAASEGRYDEARERWREFVDDHPKHSLSAIVETSIISLDREQGRFDELVARLEQLESKGKSALPRDVLLFELGVAQEEAGRGDEANSTFQTLVQEFPQSPYGARARSQPSFRAEAL